MSDCVQNHLAIAKRNRTESSPGQPLFFIGSSPSQAATIINPEYPAAGVKSNAKCILNPRINQTSQST